MAAPGGEQVYATLLLSDSYLPGALVLAHSLRDALSSKKLAVLVTLDSVSAESITQLRSIYDYVIPVPRIRNDQPANLYLMNRADLHSAFTKINLWRQTQFSKIVYIDADVLAYRAPDELFDISHVFSAAPDIGWPDIFNTGVMVLTPNMGDYYAMMAMAERGISFDGADQGLLNMYFKNNFNRLSFTYNVTPSAHYQYIPAYRHFQSSINMVHFIGSNKPWFAGRDASFGASPYDEMVGRWWAVYDRHYRVQDSATQPRKLVPEYVQYFTKGEWRPPQPTSTSYATGEHHHSGQHHDLGKAIDIGQQPVPPPHHHHHHHHPQPGHDQPGHHHDQHHHHEPPHDHEAPAGDSDPQISHSVPPSAPVGNNSGTQAEARSAQQVSQPESGGAPAPEHKPEPAPIPTFSWDAQRQPPPPDSKPEALNFPSTHYAMSQDRTPFVPPERYPSPPKNMWYEVPKEPPAPATRAAPPIFPWEAHQPRPSRWFPQNTSQAPTHEVSHSQPPPGERTAVFESGAPTESSTVEISEPETKSVPSTPSTPTIKVIPSDPWTSFPRNNAWDDVPEITRYIDGLQKHRRAKSQGTLGGSRRGPGRVDLASEDRAGIKMRGFVLTDFPSEVERPSLPVTPAPIHRPTFWGQDEPEARDEDNETSVLPAAEGVPAQSEWDPVAQLSKLAQQQSEALLRRLSGDNKTSLGAAREIPLRPLPFGSEPTIHPSYPTQPDQGVLSPRPVRFEAAAIPEPSYTGPGAAWEKDEPTPQR